MHSSPQSKPFGYTSHSGEPSTNGAFWRLRGRENITMAPVRASTETTCMESGRSPWRPSPASAPRTRML